MVAASTGNVRGLRAIRALMLPRGPLRKRTLRWGDGEEVDFVIEERGKLLPIEVKASTRPRLGDAVHLRSFRAEYGKKSRAGLLLHTGPMLEWLAPDILAAPWWRVL